MQVKLSKWFGYKPRQSTLDKWLVKPKPVLRSRHRTEFRRGALRVEVKCIALETPQATYHMELNPETDNWDGSIDNMEKVLEDHVSKYGELF